MRSRQRGMSYLGILALIAVIGGLIKVTVVVAPPYLDFLTVDKAIKSLLRETEIGARSVSEIKSNLSTRFQVNNLHDRSPEEFVYNKDGGVVTIDVDYEVRRPLFGNLDVVMTFKKTYSSADKSSN